MEYIKELGFKAISGAKQFRIVLKKDSSKSVQSAKEPEAGTTYVEGDSYVYVLQDNPTEEQARKAAVAIAGFAKSHSFSAINVGLGAVEQKKAFLEGLLICSYSFEMKSKKSDKSLKVGLLDSGKLEEQLPRLKKLFKSVNFTREMVNLPANICTIDYFAGQVEKQLENQKNIKVTVIEEKKLASLGMNALLAVAQGSKTKPKLLVVEYTPDASKKEFDLAIVGKGVVFDSGGLSLKPSKYMEDMKIDMSGAAAAMGAIMAAAELGIQKNVIAIAPLVENMPDGGATRPGDIVTAYNGKTIEILNTDAEGRVILADALSYLYKHHKAKKVVDLATLTGACGVALGPLAAGVLGNDQELIDRLIGSGNRTGEMLWQLPLWDDYSEFIKSKIADIRNIGIEGSHGGTITGAAFLKEFVSEQNWAHLDIAPVAHYSGKGAKYYSEGATGFGVRLLVDYLES